MQTEMSTDLQGLQSQVCEGESDADYGKLYSFIFDCQSDTHTKCGSCVV